MQWPSDCQTVQCKESRVEVRETHANNSLCIIALKTTNTIRIHNTHRILNVYCTFRNVQSPVYSPPEANMRHILLDTGHIVSNTVVF